MAGSSCSTTGSNSSTGNSIGHNPFTQRVMQQGRGPDLCAGILQLVHCIMPLCGSQPQLSSPLAPCLPAVFDVCLVTLQHVSKQVAGWTGRPASAPQQPAVSGRRGTAGPAAASQIQQQISCMKLKTFLPACWRMHRGPSSFCQVAASMVTLQCSTCWCPQLA